MKIKRLMKIISFSFLSLIIISVTVLYAENRVAITAWFVGKERNSKVSVRSTGRSIIINGQRINTGGFLRHTETGGIGITGNALIQSRGYGINIESKTENDGFYVNRDFSSNDLESNSDALKFKINVIGNSLIISNEIKITTNNSEFLK